MTTPLTPTARRILFPLVVALSALCLMACDDDGTPGDPDTDAMDTSTDDTAEDTAADVPDDTEGDTGEDVPDTSTDTADDTADTGDDVDDDTVDTDMVDMADTTDMGGCPDGCGTNQVCNEAAGMCECGVSFADCDSDASNGCETNISVPEQCGGCGDMADPVCQRFGIAPSCMLVTDSYRCGSDCQAGYLDIDANAGSENVSNGCETGLVAGAAQDLSAALGATGDIVALEHDGTTLFALTDDGTEYTLHALSVASDGTVSVADSEPAGPVSGAASFAVADGGFLAVKVAAQNVFYQFDGTMLTELDRDTKTNAAAVAALSVPLVANSQAEFVAAVGGGIVWYGVFAQASDAPDSGTCETNGRVCTLNAQVQPLNTNAVAVVDLGGAPWAVAMGDTTIDFEFVAATPELDSNLTAGDSVPPTALDYEPLADALAVVQDDGTVHLYEYTVAAGANPTARTDARTITPDTGSATELELLDADRWLIGTDMGLLAVLVDDTTATQADVDQPLASVDALVVAGDRAYVASGQQMVVIELDLGTLDTAP